MARTCGLKKLEHHEGERENMEKWGNVDLTDKMINRG
jgi:hypothetical protein